MSDDLGLNAADKAIEEGNYDDVHLAALSHLYGSSQPWTLVERCPTPDVELLENVDGP